MENKGKKTWFQRHIIDDHPKEKTPIKKNKKAEILIFTAFGIGALEIIVIIWKIFF